jgi:hypothetical protein
MKTRDYLFWTCLTLGSLLMGHLLRVEFAPHVAPVVRRTSLFERAVFVYGLWKLSHAAQATPPSDVQTLPDSVVNAPPERTDGPDGHPLIAHGAGW